MQTGSGYRLKTLDTTVILRKEMGGSDVCLLIAYFLVDVEKNSTTITYNSKCQSLEPGFVCFVDEEREKESCAIHQTSVYPARDVIDRRRSTTRERETEREREGTHHQPKRVTRNCTRIVRSLRLLFASST
jgi:hypothetical protein